jgi:serine/threonine protein kinase
MMGSCSRAEYLRTCLLQRLEITWHSGMVLTMRTRLTRTHNSRKILHRDIKTANIFLADEGDKEATIKLGDFGIAKVCAPLMLAISSHVPNGRIVLCAGA